MRKTFLAFLKDEEASTLLEYALLAGTVSIGWLYAGTEVRDELVRVFNRVSHEIGRLKP